MSQRPLGPTLPLTVREYATLARRDARHLFRQAPAAMRRAWGMLYCLDAAGVKWTALGDPEYTRSLQVAQVPRDPVPGYDHPREWNRKGAPTMFEAEWPVEAFGAAWAVRGWPDDWPAMGRRIETFPIRYSGFAVDADAFERLNALAVSHDTPAVTDDAIDELDREQRIIGVAFGSLPRRDGAGEWIGTAWALPMADGRLVAAVVVVPESAVADLPADDIRQETFAALSAKGRDFVRSSRG